MVCSFNNSFNIPFRASISSKDVDSLKNAKQYFSDCYLMATLDSLSHSECGRRIIKEQIQYDDKNPKLINCYLYKKNGEQEKFVIPSQAALKGYEKLYQNQSNEFVRSVDISVNEYENKYKAKPLICRIADTFNEYNFEKNLPSHFMKIFTGIEPTVNIAETDLNFDLSGHKKDVMSLFERMDKEKEHSLVIGTGPKMLDGRTWHVYVLEDVDLKNNTIRVKNKRGNKIRTMDIDTALNTFKYIVGYFNSDLKKKLIRNLHNKR